MSCAITYRVILNFEGRNVITQSARWDDSMSIDTEQVADQVFYRNKLSGKFYFMRGLYDSIAAAAFDEKFTLTLQESSNGNTYTPVFVGQFWKTDIEFDDDNRTCSVEPETVDVYRDVLAGLDKEFDLIKLAPPRTEVMYKKQPLIQVYIPGSNFVTNYLSGTWWETPVAPETNLGVLRNDYKFEAYERFGYIPGVGDGLEPDVSGLYELDLSFDYLWKRQDGAYGIDRDADADVWEIYDLNDSDNVVYRGVIGEDLTGTPSHSQPGTVFTSLTDSDSKCQFFDGFFFTRYLTDEEIVLGNPTTPVPEFDLISGSFGYKRVATVSINTFTPFDGHSTSATRYGKYDADALHFSGEYFTAFTPPILTGETLAYPLVRSEWTGVSWWFYYTPTLRTLQEAGAKTITLKHAYLLPDVLQVLLNAVTNGITHEGAEDYSAFLYPTENEDEEKINPVSTEIQPMIMITPKSNIITGEYDKPAEKAPIKLGDVLAMLWQVYRLKWWIDKDGKFRIEHISYFDRGGSYTVNQIGADLTALYEPKHAKLWSYGTSKWEYEKPNMPERLEFGWMDDVSTPFEGYPIEVRSGYVQAGNIEDNTVATYTSDLDFAQSQPGTISPDGFMLLGTIYDKGMEMMVVPFLDVATANDAWKIQNGYLSFVYLHDKFHRHSLPASDVTINEEDTSATTLKRYKIQEFDFPAFAIDPMELITTNLGNGKIEKMRTYLTSKTKELTIKHDTQ